MHRNSGFSWCWRSISLSGAALMVMAMPATYAFARAPGKTVAINIDATRNVHPINPQVYGVAFGATADLLALNAPLNRMGGNSMTTYNWALNAENLDADWYFESYPQDSATPGEQADTFVSDSQAANAQPMLTVPLIGWV